MNSNFKVDSRGCIIDKIDYKKNPKRKFGYTKKYYENLEKLKQKIKNKD